MRVAKWGNSLAVRLPDAVVEALKLKAGDKMTFTLMPDGVVVMRVKNKPVSELAALLFKKSRKPVPIEKLSRQYLA